MNISHNQKQKIKIAVPSNDGKIIFEGMLGRANTFLIFEMSNNKKINFLENRKNPHAKTMQSLKTLDVYDLLIDCSVIVSAKIGKKGIERLEKRGMELVFAEGIIQNQLNKMFEIFNKII